MTRPIVWTIAGSDSSGGAGIQADLKTFQALGVHGCSVTTAITAQNNHKLHDIEFISEKKVLSQLVSLHDNMPPDAIKIGMLGSIPLINALIPLLAPFRSKIIIDPVMISSSGYPLFKNDLNEYIVHLKKIFPLVELITPNLDETKLLMNRDITSYQDIENAAYDLLSLGVKNVLIKGGHFTDSIHSQDFWTNGNEAFWLHSARKPHQSIRGTGCTLSSAISACIALGYEMKDALVIAKMFINQSIRLSYSIKNTTHLSISTWPEHHEDLPTLSPSPTHLDSSIPFKAIAETDPLGLYPVVDNTAWLDTLLPHGVKTIQLRVKDKQGIALENEIKKAIAIANRYSAKLFVNDYWELAIKHNAYGIHLGQEDILTADLKQIQQAGIRLGISTHCYHEVARAHHIKPSYIACGPIYATSSKIMPFQPQGIEKLHRWRRTLPYPLVAIGGINLERLPDVLSTKVDGIAMISAITHASDPISMTRQLLTQLEQVSLSNAL